MQLAIALLQIVFGRERKNGMEREGYRRDGIGAGAVFRDLGRGGGFGVASSCERIAGEYSLSNG